MAANVSPGAANAQLGLFIPAGPIGLTESVREVYSQVPDWALNDIEMVLESNLAWIGGNQSPHSRASSGTDDGESNPEHTQPRDSGSVPLYRLVEESLQPLLA